MLAEIFFWITPKRIQTVDRTLHVKYNAEFDKDVTVHGSETIDKDLTVQKDLTVKGDTTIGDDANDKLTVNATSGFNADTAFGSKCRKRRSWPK